MTGDCISSRYSSYISTKDCVQKHLRAYGLGKYAEVPELVKAVEAAIMELLDQKADVTELSGQMDRKHCTSE